MIVIAQSRELDTKDVLEHCLGPVPWVPATAEGALRKTVKSSLAEYLKKQLAPVESLSANSAWPMDRMYVVQKLDACHMTFPKVKGGCTKVIRKKDAYVESLEQV